MTLRFNLVFLFLVITVRGFAQLLQDKQGDEITPYYIDFNAAKRSELKDLRGDYLHVQYYDSYGQAGFISLTIKDWQGRIVTQLSLNKTFGLNHFDIRFSDHGFSLAENEIYSFQIEDEKGKKYEAFVRYLPPVKNEVTVNIMVKPVLLLCNDALGGNLTEFFGSIEGGKAPYSVSWYVMNKGRTDFLYQPRQLVVARPDEVSSIVVDKSPEYFVMLYVKDACGNEQKSMVQVTCEQNQKKINTVFLDILPAPGGLKARN
jgi:hypothetical protein